MANRAILSEERALIAVCAVLVATPSVELSGAHRAVRQLAACLRVIAGLPDVALHPRDRAVRDLIEFGPLAQVLDHARTVVAAMDQRAELGDVPTVQMRALSAAVAAYFASRSDRACAAIGICVEAQG